jgi:hypothetical protein
LGSVDTIGAISNVIHSFVSAHISVEFDAGERLLIVIFAALASAEKPIRLNRHIEIVNKVLVLNITCSFLQ